jgi:tetratricopeptide (TPR) repeat protein
VLSAFFFFWSLYVYVRWRHEGATAWRPYWLSLALFLLALLSKVSVIALPFVLILFEISTKNQVPRIKEVSRSEYITLIPYFVLSVVFGIIAVIGKTRVIESTDPWTTVLLACKSTAFYLLKLIIPTGLTVIYPQTTPVTLGSLEFLIPVIIVVCLVIFIGFVLIRNRGYRSDLRDQGPETSDTLGTSVTSATSFGFAFYLLTLAPNYLNFIKNGFLFFASDRYPYIGSAGVLFIMATVIVKLLQSHRVTKILEALTIGLIIVFIIQTYLQARTWRTSATMYQRVLDLYPDSAMAANNLGNEIAESGDLDTARTYFERALALKPDMISARVNLGNYFRERGQFDEALAEYEKAIAVVESRPHPTQEEVAAFYIYGEALERVNRREDSIHQFEIAVSKGPLYAEAHYNLGLQYQKVHRLPEALTSFERAVELEPLFVPALYHLAGVQAETGKIDEAIATLERLIAIDPHYEKAQEHLHNMKNLRPS